MDKRTQALFAEIKDFRDRKERIKADLDAMIVAGETERDVLADKVREYLLADADWLEVRYGKNREEAMIRRNRRRANSPVFCGIYVLHLQAERLLAQARESFDLSPAEKKARDERDTAEAAELSRGIDAMMRALVGGRS